MFALQNRASEKKLNGSIHGTFVIASWGITACWMAFEIALPPHHAEALWRSSIALGLTAASSSLLIIWSLTRAVIEPANNALYYLRIGYHAGYRDAAESKQARMYALPSPRHENATTRGTGTMP